MQKKNINGQFIESMGLGRKEEPKEAPKEEAKEEPKEAPKEEVKEEKKDQPKEET